MSLCVCVWCAYMRICVSVCMRVCVCACVRVCSAYYVHCTRAAPCCVRFVRMKRLQIYKTGIVAFTFESNAHNIL